MKRYIHWFVKSVKGHWGAMTLMMLCHVLLAGCSVAFVYVCKRLVDIAVASFAGRVVHHHLWQWLAVMAGVIVLRISLNAIRTYLQTKTEIRVKNSLRSKLFDIILRSGYDDARKYHTADMINRIQEDVRVVSSAAAGAIPNFIGTLLQLLAAFSFLVYLDIRLALLIIIIVPVGLLIGKYITGRVRSLTHDIRSRDSRVQAHLQESIQHLTLLQTLEYEDESSDELGTLQGELYNSEIKRTRFSVVSRMFISLAFQAGHAVAFMWGVLGISHGTVTYGMMTAFLQLVGQIQRPLLEMSTQVPSIIHSTASIDRIMQIEDINCETSEDSVLLPSPAGIKMEGVKFAYADASMDVLDGFSFDFKPGSRTAIVGPTGVGKTTLIRLLLALLKPQEGCISIYVDAGQSTQPQVCPVSAATRCNLIYVPQGNTLFSGTIRDNLLMGNPDASESQLEDALRISAADFVFTLPYGLNTQCFEAGAGLSEGQAQRVAIARALLRPGSILLLDEFSSALDAHTETLLMERLTTSLPDHTMIFITHRDKIIDYCESTLRLG